VCVRPNGRGYLEGGEFAGGEIAGKDCDGDIGVEFGETRTRHGVTRLADIGFAKVKLRSGGVIRMEILGLKDHSVGQV
jgi:hypothetical protein